ncbi:MAG: hypothetical protein M9913_20750 [Bryobacteraceae bacterium]|nr:hypothetical protein [Bryobacteraceae bacterium]
MGSTSNNHDFASVVTDLKTAILIEIGRAKERLREPAIEEVLEELGDDAIQDLFFADMEDPFLHARVAVEYAKRFYLLDYCKAQMKVILQQYVETSLDSIVKTIDAIESEVESGEFTSRSLLLDGMWRRGWVVYEASPPSAEEAAQSGQPPEIPWPWPLTEVQHSSKKGNNLYFDRDMSGLKVCGYRVGKTNGMPQNERLRFLTYFFESKLPPEVVERCGDDYGPPKSSQRLRKMATVMAANCRNFKRNDADKFRAAIEDWESDLFYLRSHYYQNSGFEWPNTDV